MYVEVDISRFVLDKKMEVYFKNIAIKKIQSLKAFFTPIFYPKIIKFFYK